jgi:phosphomevalonate kinase
MGEKATDEKVGGIEPREQTALLNKCINLPGVIGGGVPGGPFVFSFT